MTRVNFEIIERNLFGELPNTNPKSASCHNLISFKVIVLFDPEFANILNFRMHLWWMEIELLFDIEEGFLNFLKVFGFVYTSV